MTILSFAIHITIVIVSIFICTIFITIITTIAIITTIISISNIHIITRIFNEQKIEVLGLDALIFAYLMFASAAGMLVPCSTRELRDRV